jgi:hypothetical protein
VRATDLKTCRVPNADAIFVAAWQTALNVSEYPSERSEVLSCDGFCAVAVRQI